MNLTSTACSHIADHTQAMSMSSLRAAQALRASARVLGGSLLSSEFGTNILQHKAPSSARFVSAVRAKGAVSPEADLHVQKVSAVSPSRFRDVTVGSRGTQSFSFVVVDCHGSAFQTRIQPTLGFARRLRCMPSGLAG